MPDQVNNCGEPVCPSCGADIRVHPAATCLDVLVARLMGDEVLYYPRADVSGEAGEDASISINIEHPVDFETCRERCKALTHAERLGRRYEPFPVVRKYSSNNQLVFEVLDRVEGDLLSSMTVEMNKAAGKYWVKIYYGDRGSSTKPIVDKSPALAVSRAVVIADHSLKQEAGPEEKVIK